MEVNVADQLEFDINTLYISNKKDSIKLTPIEFKLLFFLCENTDHLFSRDQLLSYVWGENTYVLSRTVDSTVKSLRKKTKGLGLKIKSVYGVGYKMDKKSS